MTDRFDVHAVRHRLKLLHDTGETELYENRDGVACPACGKPFTELLVTERATNTFTPGEPVDFCVTREADRLLVCTHETG
jgi:hypothetical protein